MKLIFSFIFLGLSALSFSIPPASLHVQIHDVRSDSGKILVLVFKNEDGFPDQVKKAFKQLVLESKKGKVEFRLDHIPAGKYAITVLHDEDDNGIMTTNFVGLPEEKYGFSNNPKIYFGPPSFGKSAVQVGSESKTIQINLR